MFTKLLQIHIWRLAVPTGYAGGGLNTGAMAAVPLVLPWQSHNSVSTHMSLMPFELLFFFFSLKLRVSACDQSSLCSDSLRGHLGFQQLFPLILTASYYGNSSSWHWSSGLGSPVRGWDPSHLRGTSATEKSILILNPPQVCVG